MCGIFGFHVNSKFSNNIQSLFEDLCKLSHSRGKEASGIALNYQNEIKIFRHKKSILDLLNTASPLNLFSDIDLSKSNFSCIGHARLVTNGNRSNIFNNQPVEYQNMVVVHNGIICNFREIWEKILEEECRFELDSMVIPAYLAKFYNTGSIQEVIQGFYNIIEGDASIACFINNSNLLLLSTNTGSIYYIEDNEGTVVFASQYSFMKSIAKKYFKHASIKQLKPKEVRVITLNNKLEQVKIIDLNKTRKQRSELKRCTSCVLPETFPGILFDEKGVCNICREDKPFQPYGEKMLEQLCEKHRKKDGSPDCVLAFSGGRDSSYALHYLKCVMGMNPVTVTYDWGLVTDLARRNIARMCGKLGVENILYSANLEEKRKNVQMNLKAWLKKPELGMVTLLMAGDKAFFYYPRKVQKDLNIELLFFASNRLEQTNFKSGFCGVHERNKWYCYVSLIQKLKMLRYFFVHFIKNKAYINTSIFDTLFSFYCAYLMQHRLTVFYDYVSWDEDKIVSTLKKLYNWETDSNNNITWRIGDGTAAFYNYIYLTMAGFTENDTFRSAQIRNGLIDRDQALEMLKQDNITRNGAMEDYAKTIGFDLNQALDIIDGAPKLYFQ